jgi:glycosyltransferase involved in cell wall biosynthesis
MSLSKPKSRLAVVSPFLDRRNGTERIAVEWITRLQDSFAELAEMLRRLYHDQDLRKRLGQNAAETVRKYTWERNGRELSMIFGDIVRRRAPEHTQAQTQES